MFATSSKFILILIKLFFQNLLAKFYKIPFEDITNKVKELQYRVNEKENLDKLIEEEVSNDEEQDKREELLFVLFIKK